MFAGAIPGHGCLTIDLEAGDSVLVLDRVAFGGRARREGRQVASVLIVDRDRAVLEPQAEATLMHEPMVAATQLHEIGEIGPATVSPMAYMVSIDPPPVRAAGEHAALVTSAQSSSE
jgi:hypothetical protein